MPQNGIVRRLLIATILAVATPAEAQRPDGATNNRQQIYRDRDDWDERHRTPEQRPTTKADKAVDGKKTAPITVVRPLEREDREERRRREHHQWKEPAAKTPEQKPKPSTASKSTQTIDRPAPLISVRPVPDSPPSPAERMQRRMEQERRNQRGEQASMEPGNFRCNAYPVCDRSSGSYGSCRGVEQFYSARSWRDARQQVARDCAAVNTPDPCNCAAQCSRVAQCGPV
jgi:hypothetical protein